MRAIFGEKASDVKDSSLRVPNGMQGVVIDVQSFTRKGIEKDSRTLQIENDYLVNIQKKLDAEYLIIEDVFI